MIRPLTIDHLSLYIVEVRALLLRVALQDILFSYGIEDTFTALDGRNRHKLSSLAPYLSELALTKYRLFIEVQYLQQLSQYKIVRQFTKKEMLLLKTITKHIDKKSYKKIREIEQRTNHEMKSVEQFLKEYLRKTSLNDVSEMVHFGLTSEDINNLSYALMLKDTLANGLIPELEQILSILEKSAKQYKSIVMLGRTHGQPALPTTLGKEYAIFSQRLKKAILLLKKQNIEGKLTGNIGNFNAHAFLFPHIDWLSFSKTFVKSLGLTPDLLTTQIAPYESILAVFQTLARINNILLGLSQDFWLYISFGYFSQKVVSKEVGSTALPHKVNPIYFEGAEGGLGLANSLFDFYARKLSYSRLQRDLSDSTVRRSFPIALCYSFLSYQSLIEALKRILPDEEKLTKDLQHHWEILSEPIQNYLRTKGYTNAYEKTKQFFRGKQITRDAVAAFIQSLTISEKDKKKLLFLSPTSYVGLAEKLVEQYNTK